MLREGLKALTLTLAMSALSANADTLVATFSYSQGDFEFTTIEGGGETFDYIDLPGECHLSVASEPMLPLVTGTLVVPWGSTVNSVAITDSASEVLEGDYYVYPAQEPMEISNGDEPPWTPPDPDVYGSDDAYPGEVLQDGGPATSRGHLLYYFDLVPMQYTPADEEIELYTFIEVTLDYTPPDPAPEATRMEHAYTYDLWSDAIGRMVANGGDVVDYREPVNFVDVNRVVEMEYEGETIEVVEENESQYYQYSAPPEAPGDFESKAAAKTYPYSYVIITNNYWQHDGSREEVGDLFQEFASEGWPPENRNALRRFKTRKGFCATVRTVDWIKQNYAGDDAQEKVQAFLNDAYENWATAFVLLAGDVEKPVWYKDDPEKSWRRSGRYGVVPVRHLCADPDAQFNPNKDKYIFNSDEVDITPGDIYYSAVDDWDVEYWDGNDNGIHGQMIENVEMWSFAPDLAVGRVAVGKLGDAGASEQEARDFQDKVYDYETAPMGRAVPPVPPYLEKTLLIATEDWAKPTNEIADYIQLPEGKKDRQYEEGSVEKHYIRYPRYPEPHNVIEKMDETFGISFIFCHGCPYCFYIVTHDRDYSVSPYTQSTPAKKHKLLAYHGMFRFPHALENLNNSGLGVLYTTSCDVNRIDIDAADDSLSEVYVLQDNHGGVAFLGNNRAGYTGRSDDLAKEFFDYLFDAGTPNPNDGVPEAGLAEALSKRKQCGPKSILDRFIAYTHDVNGEPEFSIYTDEPHIFDVDFETIQIRESPDEFLVTVTVTEGVTPVEYARVCVWVHDQDTHLVGGTDAEGIARFRVPGASCYGCTELMVSRGLGMTPAYPFIVHSSLHAIIPEE
jgi:hypothetical protein